MDCPGRPRTCTPRSCRRRLRQRISLLRERPV
jgi:hypothetical protein